MMMEVNILIGFFQIYRTLRGRQTGVADPALPRSRHPVHPRSRDGRVERLRRDAGLDGQQRRADSFPETDLLPVGPNCHFQYSSTLRDDAGVGFDVGQ